jgi:hypothetical protein
MMWIGLSMSFDPLNTMLDILPFLGSAGRFVTGAIMFGIAFSLSLVTIIIAIIAHNIFLMIGLFVLLIGGIMLWSRVRKPTPAIATA